MTNTSSRDPVLLTLKDEVATLTINRPQAKNALTLRTIDTLLLMLRALEVDSEVKALIVTGSGDNFCAGEDHSEHGKGDPEAIRVGLEKAATELAQAVRCFPKLVITKIRGSAHGLGLELVVASDVAIASEDATIAAASLQDGAGRMAVATLNRFVGPKKAASLLFTGEVLNARAAEKLGLVSRVVDASEIDACVETAARNAVDRCVQDFASLKLNYRQQASPHSTDGKDNASESLAAAERHSSPETLAGSRQTKQKKSRAKSEVMPLDV